MKLDVVVFRFFTVHGRPGIQNRVTHNQEVGSFHAKTAKVGRAKKIDLAEILYACRGAHD